VIRLLIRAIVFLLSAAVGLLVAASIFDDVEVTTSGFVVAVVVFAVLQSVLSPFIMKVAMRNAPAFTGGIGLISTFVALVVASLFGDGLEIGGGIGTWIGATVVVWLVTALATLLIPFLLVKAGVEKAREERSDR
jgi:hypothetical protein